MPALLQTPLPALNDHEGAHVPEAFAEVIDAHVHLFPDNLEHVIMTYPGLRVCVPHLGADEFESYCRLLETYDNLWLDTTMTLSDYLPFDDIPNIAEMRADRIIFGSDFPSLPDVWDREIKQVGRLKLSPERLAGLLYKNALEFYSIIGQGS